LTAQNGLQEHCHSPYTAVTFAKHAFAKNKYAFAKHYFAKAKKVFAFAYCPMFHQLPPTLLQLFKIVEEALGF
jgi:hypothetical protein